MEIPNDDDFMLAGEEDLLEQLFKEVQRPEFEWKTVAAIALFHKQTCSQCTDEHKFFMGWFTAQEHRTDKFSRRLVKGMPPDANIQHRVEVHDQGIVPLCATCVLIDQAIGGII